MLQLGVTATSTASKPRTAATATTHFSRFCDGDAFGTYQSVCRRCNCPRVYATMLKPQKRKHKKKSPPGMHEDLSKWFCLGLTFAGLESLNPTVISVPVANASAIFIPSTARGAATDSA